MSIAKVEVSGQMDDNRVNYILGNAKKSMEIEGFVIDAELEEIGRQIVTGDLDIEDYVTDYINQYKLNAARVVHEV